ncbi:ABC transporter substrate-binding protein [Roseateles oligotrophus]|uniref:ABC transporter substrate-binding protein n=1 Tax=Roseateles oligotrophus TaxID=1769250 RepID=A0ABT2YK65_9BURK|nr:ABC transporter substrate-binding protein [Roseateles oligotrophus]MCV2370392.1 ABC transporter substrate-binding protein [Roseateles oligotrophus]
MHLPPKTSPPSTQRRLLLGGAVAFGLGLCGCSPPLAPLRVGAIAFAGYGFLFLAQDLGLLHSAGIRMHELRSNTDVLRALALGRLEAAALTLDEVLTGLHDGLRLKVVAVLDVSAGADAVMARAGLTRPEMARGQRVAVEGSAAGALMLSAFLESAGLSPDEVRLVTRPLPETAAALRDGTADLAVTAEPWVSQLEAEGATRLFDSRQVPGRIVDVLAVRSELLETRPDAIHSLVKAHFACLERFQRDPGSVVDRLALQLQIEPGAVASAFRGLELPDRKANEALLSPGGDVAQGLRGLAELLHRKGLIASPVDASGLIDTRWVRGTP